MLYGLGSGHSHGLYAHRRACRWQVKGKQSGQWAQAASCSATATQLRRHPLLSTHHHRAHAHAQVSWEDGANQVASQELLASLRELTCEGPGSASASASVSQSGLTAVAELAWGGLLLAGTELGWRDLR